MKIELFTKILKCLPKKLLVLAFIGCCALQVNAQAECQADVVAPDATAAATAAYSLCNNVTGTITGNVIAGDDCAGGTITYTIAVMADCNGDGTVTAQADIMVAVSYTGDNTPPTSVGGSYTGAALTCTSAAPGAGDFTAPTGTDAKCGGTVTVSAPTIAAVDADGKCGPESYTATYTLTDACGETAEAVVSATVSFDTPPSCPTNATAAAVACFGDIAETPPGDLMHCGESIPAVLVSGPIPAAAQCPYTAYSVVYTYEYTFCDDTKCTYTSTHNVAAQTTPTVMANDGQAVECDGDIAVPTAPPAVANACAFAPDVMPTGPVIADTYTCMNGQGMKTYTWTYTFCDGSTKDYVHTATVMDVSSPADPVPPADVTITCMGALPPPPVIMVADNCDGMIVAELITSPAAPDLCTGGVIVREWQATDCAGNMSAVVMQTITVEPDTDGPVLALPDDITLNCEMTDADEDAIIAAWLASASAIDECTSAAAVTSSLMTTVAGCATGLGVFTYEFTTEDGCGNTTTGTATVTIEDNEKPWFEVPADITVAACAAIPAAPAVTIMDCDPAASMTTADVVNDGECPKEMIITREFKAVDCSGNETKKYQTIHVIDNVAPTPTVIAPGSLVCSVNNPDVAADAWAAGIAASIPFTDGGCSDITVNFELMSFAPSCAAGNNAIGTYTYEFEATDACGNKATTMGNFVVSDGDVPMLILPANITVDCELTAPEQQSMRDTWAATAQVIDGCNGTIVPPTPTVTSVAGCASYVNVYTYEWEGDDGCGNTVTMSRTVTEVDNENPTFDVPADMVIDCAADFPADPVAAALNIQDCDPSPVVAVATSDLVLECAAEVRRTYTITVTDACGNATVQSFHVTKIDNTPPTITVADAAAVECTGGNHFDLASTWAASQAVIGNAADASCGPVSHVDYELMSFVPGCSATAGVYTFEFRAYDACGNVGFTTATYTVTDMTGPVITPPANITINCDVTDIDEAGIIEAWVNGAVAIDACDNTVVVTNDGGVFVAGCHAGVGVWTYTFNAADACGNAATAVTATVTIEDNEKPIVIIPADVWIGCGDALPAMTQPTIMDCESGLTADIVDALQPNPECPTEEVTIRSFTVTDCSGNETIEYQTITKVDNVAPVFAVIAPTSVECLAEDMDAEADTWAALQAIPANAPDVCSDVLVDYELVSFIPGCSNTAGVYTYEFKATDDCGNIATTTSTYTVTDVTPPVLTAPDDITISCDMTDIDEAGIIEAWENGATAIDGCDNTVLPTFTKAFVAGCHAGIGVWTYTFVAEDACGNAAAAQMKTVTIEDNEKPVLEVAGPVVIDCGDTYPAASHTVVDCDPAVVVAVTEAITPGECPSEEILVRTYTATDCSGNVSTRHQILRKIDNTDPAPTAIPAGSAQCPNGNPDVLAEAWAAGIAAGVPFTDDCSAIDVDFELMSNTAGCGVTGEYVYEFKGTDACGNTTVTMGTFTVTDGTAPTLVAPDNITISCEMGDLEEDAIIEAWENDALVIDGCDGTVPATFLRVWAAGCHANIGVWTYTFDGVDACGNSAVDEIRTVTIRDTEKPIVIIPADVIIDCAVDFPVAVQPTIMDCEAGLTAVIVDAPQLSECPSEEVIIRSFTVTDCSGNTTVEYQTLRKVDNTAPTITVANNAAVECADINGYDAADTWAASQAIPANTSDDCSDVLVDYELVSFVPTCGDAAGVYTYEFKATDACGNVGTTTATYTITDNTGPVITAPFAADLFLECDFTDLDDFGIFQAWASAASAIDACDNSVPVDVVPGDIIPGCSPGEFTLPVTFTAADDCGNVSEVSLTVVMSDFEPPVFEVPADMVITCGSGPPTPSPIPVIDCDDAAMAIPTVAEALPFECPGERRWIVTWTATDCSGNETIKTQTVTEVDNTAPVFAAIVPGGPVECTAFDMDAEADTWAASAATATDDCNDVSIDYELVSFVKGCGNAAGVYTYEFKATDACGNVSTATSIYTVIDTEAPTLVVPAAPLVLDCSVISATTGATAMIDDWLATASAADGCDNLPVLSHDYNTYDLDICAGADYAITVTWTATDACGNEVSAAQDINVIVDAEAPNISCPSAATIQANVNCGILLPDYTSNAVAGDDCDTDVFVTQSPAPGNTVIVGIYPITLTATDNCGKETECTFTIEVVDATNPIALCQDITVQLDATGAASIIAADVSNNSVENCGIMSISIDEDAFTCSDIGNNPITLTVTDNSGNASTCIANVMVEDVIAPTFTCPASPMNTSGCDGLVPNLLNGLGETDECGGTVILTQSPVAGTSIGGAGNSVDVTITATDASGNASNCMVTINVIDAAMPSFQFCPPTIEVNAFAGQCDAFAYWQAPIAVDNCALMGAGSVVQDSGPAPGTLPVGDHAITYIATDLDGNEAECTIMVKVIDKTPPTFITTIPLQLIAECDAIPDAFDFNPEWHADDNCSTVTHTFVEDQIDVVCANTYTLKRTWTITDESGNKADHIQKVFVQDTTDPTPVCQDISIMLTGGTATITPAMIDNGSADNCSTNLTFDLDSNTFDCDDAGSEHTVSLTVTDECGNDATCTAIVTVEGPKLESANIVGTNVSCPGSNDGAADLTVVGGKLPLVYDWAHGANTEDLADLAPGTYTVTVIDANGCTVTASVTITEALELDLSVAVTDITCNGGGYDGAVDLSVNNGTAPYTYLWATTATNGNGATTEDLTGIGIGSYTVTVTDVNGCSKVESVTIGAPDNCIDEAMIVDPCDCANPNNVRLADGSLLLQDVVRIIPTLGSTVISASLTFHNGGLLDATGAPLSQTATFVPIGGGEFGLEVFTLPFTPGTFSVDVVFSSGTQSFTGLTTSSDCDCTAVVESTIPTMSEWGLFLFALMILNLGLVFVYRQELILAGSNNISMSAVPFDKKSFVSYFWIILFVLGAIFLISIIGFGYTLMAFDIPGSFLTAGLLAYMGQFIKNRELNQ